MTKARAEILLVGLGNIGYRHLQGLGQIKDRVRLWAVDQDGGARERAVAEWRRLGGELGGVFETLDGVSAAADVCVLATPARGRLRLLEQVLLHVAGDAVVLEKVAFLSMAEMRDAGVLFEANGKRAFVNCARRLWPIYQMLRDRISGRPIELHVSGREFGLGSNGVHFLDLLQFLSGETVLELVDWRGHDVLPAKRAGYYEVRGALRARTPNGSSIVISAMPDDPAPHAISLDGALGPLEIDEMAGVVRGEQGWTGERAPYQSELTGLLAASLLDAGHCALPDFAASAAAHAVLLEALGRQFAVAGLDCSSGAPIT